MEILFHGKEYTTSYLTCFPELSKSCHFCDFYSPVSGLNTNMLNIIFIYINITYILIYKYFYICSVI